LVGGGGANYLLMAQPLTAHCQSHSFLTLFYPPTFYFNFILLLISFYFMSVLVHPFMLLHFFLLDIYHLYYTLYPFYLCSRLSSLTYLLSLLHFPPSPTSALGITVRS
jgi:hypothetical protein